MTKKTIIAELSSKKKKVTLYFEDMVIDKIIQNVAEKNNTDKVKIILKQKVIRLIETKVHEPLKGDMVKVSPNYDDIRTKTQKIESSLLTEKKLKVGSIIKNEFIKRICSTTPFWPEQKASSSGYYITTEIVSAEQISEGDELRVKGCAPVNVLATERDLYHKDKEMIVNIRINKEVKINSKELIVK